MHLDRLCCGLIRSCRIWSLIDTSTKVRCLLSRLHLGLHWILCHHLEREEGLSYRLWYDLAWRLLELREWLRELWIISRKLRSVREIHVLMLLRLLPTEHLLMAGTEAAGECLMICQTKDLLISVCQKLRVVLTLMFGYLKALLPTLLPMFRGSSITIYGAMK